MFVFLLKSVFVYFYFFIIFFNVMMVKIKNIILIYLKIKNILKNNYYYNTNQ